MAPAAPSREAPSASTDLEAGLVLKLGEYADEPTLNASEARIILQRTLDNRRRNNPNGQNIEPTEVTAKMQMYLELFAQFKNVAEAQQLEGIINSYAKDLERFEKSQLGTLVPGSADEAKALIPSLEGKVSMGILSERDLDDLCRDLKKLERQAQL